MVGRRSEKDKLILMIIPTLCEQSVVCDIIQVCSTICILTAIIPFTRVTQIPFYFGKKSQQLYINVNSNKALNMSGFKTIILTFTSEQEIFTKNFMLVRSDLVLQ